MAAAISSDSGQTLGNSGSHGVALRDVDGDGDLDAFVTNFGQPNKVWRNNGGNFTDSGQNLGSSYSTDAALGDVDGDGDLDAFVANSLGQANKVWRNDGSGDFSDSYQGLGSSDSRCVALGDVDGDGDLDAFVANDGQAKKAWLYTPCLRGYDQGYQEGHDQGYQEGLEACSKAVGGAVEPVDLSELGTTSVQSHDGTGTHTSVALWAGLAAVLAIGGGIFVLRRRRAH